MSQQNLDLSLEFHDSKSSGSNLSNFNDLRSPHRRIIDIRNLTRMLLLLNIDLLAIILGWYLTKTIFTKFFLVSGEQLNLEIDTLLFPIIFLNIILLTVFEGYKRGEKSRKSINYVRAISVTCISLMPTIIHQYEINSFHHVLLAFFVTFFLIILFLVNSFRYVFFSLLLYLRCRFISLRVKVCLIGEQKDIEKAVCLINKSKEFKVYSWLDISKFNTKEEVIDIINQLKISEVDEILVCSWDKVKNKRNLLLTLQCSSFYWRILEFTEYTVKSNLEFSCFEGIGAFKAKNYQSFGNFFRLKRTFDVVGSLLILILFGCPMLIIAMLIKLDSSGPILFKQTRIGLKGNKFQIWKFRTMIQNANFLQEQLENKNEFSGGILFKIKEDPRITKIGKYLRKWSLDELPQIFNILRGEMSLIGPRPLPERDVKRFTPEHYFRQEVLPGITGLWQVSGRSDTDSENMFYLDFEYIQNWSLTLDLKILLKTIRVVLNTKGAY